VAALYLDIETSLLLSNPKSKARHTRELQLQGLPFALAISDSAERGHKTWLPKKLAELWAVMLPADLVVTLPAAKAGRLLATPRRPKALRDAHQQQGRVSAL
jgi:hypothetical protein